MSLTPDQWQMAAAFSMLGGLVGMLLLAFSVPALLRAAVAPLLRNRRQDKADEEMLRVADAAGVVPR